VLDRSGALWAGTTMGIARLDARAAARGAPLVSDVIRPSSDLPHRFVSALFESADGTLWAGALALGVLPPERQHPLRFRWFTTANGLTQNDVTCFAEDRDGNLWIGTEAGGATRLTRGGFVAYGEAEGLVHPRIASLFETTDGRLCASTEYTLACFDGERFASAPLPVPQEQAGWGWYQWIQQDRAGDWWLPTREELRRYAGVRGPPDLAGARYATLCDDAPGPEPCNVFRVFEDAQADLWIGTISTTPRSQLVRWERATGRLQRVPLANGLTIQAPTAFREDGHGGLWIGLFDGGVARWRDGRFEQFAERDGFPPGLVRALLLDAKGRLWAGTERGGLARIDDPGAAQPTFKVLTAAAGLSSDLVAALVEDGDGHLYVGTDRGLDRLDPETGRIEHFGAADGLPNTYINTALRDRAGQLWFGTLNGAARLGRERERPAVPPPVFIERLLLAGRPYPVSQLGEAELTGIRLAPADNRVQIEFGGISFAAGGGLRYQHRLEGIDHDWTEPDPARSVDYANLAAGRYRFAVRAVTADGRTSPREADVHFEVLRPFWARWWFIALMLGALGAVAMAVHRTRVARAVELERVRTRIASDLHDDIGASLSKIAILSDIAQQAGAAPDETRGTLVRIADTSREMVDSMGDIVWAINPKRDHLADVVQRMRRFASDALAARDIAFTFEAPTDGTSLALGADLRRQAYLVFKESVNNAVKHAGCTAVGAALRVAGNRLQLEVRDNGRGFDPSAAPEGPGGNGLASMKRRAAELGGTLELDSRPGAGTTVRLDVPLPRRSYLFR
jgi:signal transduction histidine kinase/sugar lactone lactonase YvrE